MPREVLSSQHFPHASHWFQAADQAPQIRCLTYKDVPSLTDPVTIAFIKRHKIALVFPLSVMAETVAYCLRSLSKDKAFLILGQLPGFYSAETLKMGVEDYRYGTPILLAEGVVDAELLSTAYPYVKSYLTSAVSIKQAQLISCFTDTVVIVPDQDASGERGYSASVRSLRRYGVKASCLNLPAGVKDAGDLFKPEYQAEKDLFLTEVGVALKC